MGKGRLIFAMLGVSLALMAGVGGCRAAAAADGEKSAAANRWPLHVSIIDLIVRPDELPQGYDHIAVVGFLEESGSYLYLNKDYADFADVGVIHVASPKTGFLPKRCTNRFVRVTGIWRRDPPRLRGIAEIEKVEIMERSKARTPAEIEREKHLVRAPVVCWNRGKTAKE